VYHLMPCLSRHFPEMCSPEGTIGLPYLLNRHHCPQERGGGGHPAPVAGGERSPCLPSLLAYFNAAVGGAAGETRYVTDSNKVLIRDDG
jgi:hypothetical protein